MTVDIPTAGGLPDEEEPAERQMRFLFALRSRGITDMRVLTAMERIDRGAFVRGLFAERAYEDMPLPISCGQTISQPSVVGLMTQALNVQPRDTVLEIGTGSAIRPPYSASWPAGSIPWIGTAVWYAKPRMSFGPWGWSTSPPLPAMAAMACQIRHRLTAFW